MYSLPVTVEVNGKIYHIRNKGDYRMILDCFTALQDDELDQDEFRIETSLIIFYEEFNSPDDFGTVTEDELRQLILEMFLFMNMGKESEESSAQQNMKLIDWEDDSQLICSAVNNVAKQEIRALEYVHWWTFMGWYLAVGESVLSTVVSIRHKLKTGKKLEKWEKDFRKENPSYFRNKRERDELDIEEEIRRMFQSTD